MCCPGVKYNNNNHKNWPPSLPGFEPTDCLKEGLFLAELLFRNADIGSGAEPMKRAGVEGNLVWLTSLI